MADDRLTAFLVALCTDETLLGEFQADKEKVLRRKKFALEEPFITAILADDEDGLKAMIGGQQGGGGKGRAKEANQLAKRAAQLTKSSVDVATSAAALAKSISGAPTGAKPGKKR